MATRKDHKDRRGKSLDMVKRTVRLTEEENEKLNKILELRKTTLRDEIAYLIEIRHEQLVYYDLKVKLETLMEKYDIQADEDRQKEFDKKLKKEVKKEYDKMMSNLREKI